MLHESEVDVIRTCSLHDMDTMLDIINDSARAYRGIIPNDRWKEPYMPREELLHEIAQGVQFWCYECDGEVRGIMGIQDVQDVTLIRHAYVRSSARRTGMGGRLLHHLLAQTDRPVLIGTWAAATWAIRFYEKHGFRQVDPQTKDRLLQRYWSIPERQVQTSVVLADVRWHKLAGIEPTAAD